MSINLNPALAALMLIVSASFSWSSRSQENLSEPLAVESDAEMETIATTRSSPYRDEEQLDHAEQFIKNKVSELETQFGPYYSGITENLINLGRVYLAQGQHELAQNTFERSLEVHRINSGLHNAEQIPIVEQLVQINRTLQEWSNVDENYEYLYWLHRRVYGADSPELLPMLTRLTMWKVEAINAELFGNRETLVKQARNAYRRANNIIKKHPELKTNAIELSIAED